MRTTLLNHFQSRRLGQPPYRELVDRDSILRIVLSISILFLSWCATTRAVSAAEVDPAAQQKSVALLTQIAAIENGFEFNAWVNDGERRSTGLDQKLEYHFLSENAASLLVLHVDSAGRGTLLFPNQPIAIRLEPGVTLDFPPAGGPELSAKPPTGTAYLLAIATPKPIGASELGIDMTGVVQPGDVPAVLNGIEERVRGIPSSDRAVVLVEQRITEHDKFAILQRFNARSRSVNPARMDVHLSFDSGRHLLHEAARTELDVFAEAMQDPSMMKKRFIVGGHTDDVGSADANRALSQRRAESVLRYLTAEKGIDSSRLTVRAYGEDRPSMAGNTDDARAMNRRVEFELAR